MTGPERAERARRDFWQRLSGTIGTVTVSLIVDIAANLIASHGRAAAGWLLHTWVYAALIALSVAGAAATAWSAYQWRRETPSAKRIEAPVPDPRPAPGSGAPTGLTRTFPARPSLLGRPADDSATAAVRARRSGVVLITGAVHGGTSAVAIAAGWKLAPEQARQRYVDLREDSAGPEDQRRTIIRVLRELGLPPEAADSPWSARRAIAAALGGTGVTLLLDNAEQPDQVSWLLDGIPGAYVIACGDIWPGGDSPRGAEHLRVGTLDPDAALELLKRQGDPDAGADAPARSEEKSGAGISRTRVRRWLGRAVGDPGPRPAAPPPVNTVARRVEAASEQDRRQLAGHLGLPRVAVDLGRWLAANPEINLTDLLGKLGKDPEGDLLYILRQQLDGTSPGARRLLRLLAEAPVAELTEAAVARLAGVAPERAGEYLAELTGRSLVSRPRLGKCRITPQARQLALGPALTDPPGRDAVARSRVRLAAYYGRLAAVHAGDLGEAAAREWLSAEDAALLQLLRDPEPPRRAAAYLWRIADVLDAWFAREQRSEDRRTAAAAMARAAAALDDRPARVTACLRLAALARESGDFAGAASHLDQADGLAGRRAALRLQVNAAWAAHLLVRGDLARAGDYLLLCRQARPRRDLRGRIADLVNQAALQLRRGEPEAADGTLGQAQSLAARAGDVGGDAHVSELAGIVAALTGHPQRAEREWERARTLYEQAGDVSGRARCLQHHGTLLSAAPGGPWDTAVAADMLTRSLELRGEDPAGLGPALAHLYLAEADQYLAEADPDLAGGDRRSPDADLTAGDPRSTDADRRSAGGGRRSAGTGQRSADGGKRSAGEGLAGDGRRAHRAAGLRALRPWPHQGSEPPEVMAVRKRLESA